VFFVLGVVVPRGSVVVLNCFNVSRIDRKRGVEQAADGSLLDEPVGDIVDNALKAVRKRSIVSLDGGLSSQQ